jgi:uncharacterized Zn-binding protein involved in type VI secretion
MGSKGVTRIGDKTTGHGPYKPRATHAAGAGGSTTVFADNLGVNRQGDTWFPHTPPPNDSHANQDNQTTTNGSGTVFADGKPVARIGDTVDGADKIAGGSATVFAGD